MSGDAHSYVVSWKSRSMAAPAFWYYSSRDEAVADCTSLRARGCEAEVRQHLNPVGFCVGYDQRRSDEKVERLENGIFGGQK